MDPAASPQILGGRGERQLAGAAGRWLWSPTGRAGQPDDRLFSLSLFLHLLRGRAILASLGCGREETRSRAQVPGSEGQPARTTRCREGEGSHSLPSAQFHSGLLWPVRGAV